MPAIDRQALRNFVDAGELAQNKNDRGRALEDFICCLFNHVPGVTVTQRNSKNIFKTEEIDVALWNERDRAGLYFLPHIILIECKNWSTRIGSVEINWFDSKLRNRGLDFGILICPKGITGESEQLTAAHSTISRALFERRRLVVLTIGEILALEDTESLSNLLKIKLCSLAVNGTISQYYEDNC